VIFPVPPINYGNVTPCPLFVAGSAPRKNNVKAVASWAKKLYASTGEIKDADSRIFEARSRLAEGFKTIKIRVHAFDVQTDIDHVRAVVDAGGGTK